MRISISVLGGFFFFERDTSFHALEHKATTKLLRLKTRSATSLPYRTKS